MNRVVDYLKTTITEIIEITDNQEDKPYKELGFKLHPIYSWENEFKKGITQILEVVATSLETGKVDLDHPNLKRANVLNVNLLAKNLNRLINLGYTGSVAKDASSRAGCSAPGERKQAEKEGSGNSRAQGEGRYACEKGRGA